MRGLLVRVGLLAALVVILFGSSFAASVYLSHVRLQAAADAAARAAVTAIDIDEYYRTGIMGPTPLDHRAARIRASAAASALSGTRSAVVERFFVMGPQVHVELRMPLDLSFFGSGVGLQARAQSRARLVYVGGP